MKKRIQLLCLVALFIISASSALAGPLTVPSLKGVENLGLPPELEISGEHREKLEASVALAQGLTTRQRQLVGKIFARHETALRALADETRKSVENIKSGIERPSLENVKGIASRLKDWQEALDTDLMRVLTKRQRAQYEAGRPKILDPEPSIAGLEDLGLNVSIEEGQEERAAVRDSLDCYDAFLYAYYGYLFDTYAYYYLYYGYVETNSSDAYYAYVYAYYSSYENSYYGYIYGYYADYYYYDSTYSSYAYYYDYYGELYAYYSLLYASYAYSSYPSNSYVYWGYIYSWYGWYYMDLAFNSAYYCMM